MSFDKKTISKNFSKAAVIYDDNALVQKLAAEKLCQIVAPFVKDDSRIIDLGSGTSAIYKNLISSKELKKNCELFEADISLSMLRNWDEKASNNVHSILCDIENLPLKNESFDVIISSFSLQWLQDFNRVFANFRKVLRKNGVLAFCVPNSFSLEEIKTASVKTGCNFYFSDLPQDESLKLRLKEAGFKEKYFKSEIVQFEFENALQALKSLRKIGAGYSGGGNFVSKEQLKNFRGFGLENNGKFLLSWGVSYFVFDGL